MRNQCPARLKRVMSRGCLALAALAWSTPAVSAQATPRQRSIRIVGTDYAFAAPDTVVAGPSAFSFENHGTKRHEVAVVLARPGTTAAQIVAAAQAGLPAPRLAEAYGDGPPLGALFVAPGGKSRALLVSTLERGRVSVLVCTLRDTPTMPEHAVLGMFHVIHVR
jgi:hypothetical protein